MLKLDEIDKDLAENGFYLHGGYWRRTTHIAETRKIGKRKWVHLHRIVMERILGRPLLSTEIIDHKNRDREDNRRENLRLATFQQNAQNRMKPGISGRPGVIISAGINVNGKHLKLGHFATVEEASAAYQKAALEHFGEFANLS